jgi:integrase
MSREIHKLSHRQVTTAEPPADRRAVLLGDGGGLYLQVSRSEASVVSRSWVFRYERGGKRHDLGLGPITTLSLAEARTRARTLRVQLVDGQDPFAARQQQHQERLAQRAERARATTFRDCALRLMEGHNAGWRSAVHRRQWLQTLEDYAFPIIGNLPVNEIDTPLVIKVLEPIWTAKPETASRLRGRIEKVLGWATVREFRSGDNPARWRGHLQEMFAAKEKLAPVEHHEALPYADVPAFMAELRERNHIAARGLEFTILAAVRTGETLKAEWDEIDFAAKVWTVPASHTKRKRELRVPLSGRALEILASLPREGVRIFPVGVCAMDRMSKSLREDVTVHGFRSSFRDWTADQTSYPEVVAEQALGHAVGTKVERAYQRSDLYEKRRKLMEAWAGYCSRPATAVGQVINIRA